MYDEWALNLLKEYIEIGFPRDDNLRLNFGKCFFPRKKLVFFSSVKSFTFENIANAKLHYSTPRLRRTKKSSCPSFSREKRVAAAAAAAAAVQKNGHISPVRAYKALVFANERFDSPDVSASRGGVDSRGPQRKRARGNSRRISLYFRFGFCAATRSDFADDFFVVAVEK